MILDAKFYFDRVTKLRMAGWALAGTIPQKKRKENSRSGTYRMLFVRDRKKKRIESDVYK